QARARGTSPDVYLNCSATASKRALISSGLSVEISAPGKGGEHGGPDACRAHESTLRWRSVRRADGLRHADFANPRQGFRDGFLFQRQVEHFLNGLDVMEFNSFQQFFREVFADVRLVFTG